MIPERSRDAKRKQDAQIRERSRDAKRKQDAKSRHI